MYNTHHILNHKAFQLCIKLPFFPEISAAANIVIQQRERRYTTNFIMFGGNRQQGFNFGGSQRKFTLHNYDVVDYKFEKWRDGLNSNFLRDFM